MACLHVCVCVNHVGVCSSHGSQKRASDSLGTGIPVKSHHVGAGSSARAASSPSNWTISPVFLQNVGYIKPMSLWSIMQHINPCVQLMTKSRCWWSYHLKTLIIFLSCGYSKPSLLLILKHTVKSCQPQFYHYTIEHLVISLTKCDQVSKIAQKVPCLSQ